MDDNALSGQEDAAYQERLEELRLRLRRVAAGGHPDSTLAQDALECIDALDAEAEDSYELMEASRRNLEAAATEIVKLQATIAAEPGVGEESVTIAAGLFSELVTVVTMLDMAVKAATDEGDSFADVGAGSPLALAASKVLAVVEARAAAPSLARDM